VGIQMTDALVLRATICEIERGLYYVAYNVDGVGLAKHPLPRYQAATSAAEAKRHIEQFAHEFGFAVVLWESALAAPVLPSPATEAAPPGD